MKNTYKQIIEKNREGNRWFIKFWANYMCTNSDKMWSDQQKELIDSQFKNTKQPNNRPISI